MATDVADSFCQLVELFPNADPDFIFYNAHRGVQEIAEMLLEAGKEEARIDAQCRAETASRPVVINPDNFSEKLADVLLNGAEAACASRERRDEDREMDMPSSSEDVLNARLPRPPSPYRPDEYGDLLQRFEKLAKK